jgi:ribosome biogenesis GTPase
VIHAFPDLAELTGGCPRACSHDEPDCALNAVEDPDLMMRIDSLRRLIRSRAADVAMDADEVG